MASSKLQVKLFGRIAVSRGSTTLGGRDFGGTKAKQLFELLVLARGEPDARRTAWQTSSGASRSPCT